MSKFTYKDLQPHVEMLIDALENKGASNSGFSNEEVYPYAEKYRCFLQDIRDKKVARFYLDRFLQENKDKIMKVTKQPYRTEQILNAIKIYFYKEFMKR